jgi:hypothetical protein
MSTLQTLQEPILPAALALLSSGGFPNPSSNSHSPRLANSDSDGVGLFPLQMCSKWELIKVAIGHRTGVVAVKEASVIITVSSAHRRASLEVTAPSHHPRD